MLTRFASAARRDAILVVPTARDAEHYLRELAEGRTVFGTTTTFAGLVRVLAARAGFQAPPPLSTLAAGRALRRALGRLEFDVLARSAAGAGFPAAAAALIAELERSLVTPQRFAQALSAWAAVDSARAPYAHELGRIPLAYARELQRAGRLDGDQFARGAVDALRAEPGRWGDTPVFVYGFDDLTPLQRDTVETLARVAGTEVVVSLTFEAGRSALDSRAEVVAELRTIAEQVLELPALREYYAPGARSVLHHLERRVFEPGSERVPAGRAVALIEAGGELAEAEALAAEVRELISSGVPPEEIAIVMRSPDRLAPLVAEVLLAYGVPVDSELGVRFSHTALGRAVRGLVRCGLGGPDRAPVDDVLAVLRHPGGGERSVADQIESECRRTGITSAGALGRRWPEALALARRLGEAAEPDRELGCIARELVAAGARGEGGGALDADGEGDARALGALLTALAEATELGERLDATELEHLVDELEVPAAPGRRGVRLSDPLAIRAQRYRVVLVAGLVEGTFPSPAVAEPFLSDEDRWELAGASGLRLAPREDSLPRERYLFYASVSRATERVVLAYRSSDEEGNLVLPSPFIADVAELLEPEWEARRRRRLLADVVWPPEEAPTARERSLSLAAASAATGARPVSGTGEGERRLGERALGWVRHRRIVSAGALERHADCPMSWLVDRQLEPLGLDPRPEPLRRGELARPGAGEGHRRAPRSARRALAEDRSGPPRCGARPGVGAIRGGAHARRAPGPDLEPPGGSEALPLAGGG